jgi:competence protein ComEC
VRSLGRALLLLAVAACSKPPAPTEPASSPPLPAAAASTGTGPTPPTSSVPPAPAPSSASATPPSACGGGRKLVVHFYDVDQALAVLVDLPDGRHVLVDTGDSPRRPSCGDVCAAADRHLLAKLGADLHGAPIDLVWITHQHSDHIGGASEVLSTFHVGTYADNGRDTRKAEVRRAHQAAADRGTAVRIVDPDHPDAPIASSPDVRITPILPSAWPASCAHDANDCSIALRIDFCASSVLFTGDAEHEEEAVLDPHGHVDLLQVGHHGSETSTTPGFLAKVRPSYAVISAGKPTGGMDVTYCHPRAIIAKRLTTLMGGAGSKTLRAFDGDRCVGSQPSDWVDVRVSDHLWATERDGDVVLSTTGDGVFARE